jgi:HlyD family type I secretion membrane fusion protein
VSGLEQQKYAIEEQMISIDDEIDRLQRGQESGVITANQLASMRRSRLDLQGSLGAITSEIAKLRQTMAETRLQIVQVKQDYVERAGHELRDIREQLSETTERTMVARDVLDRTVVTAPVRGVLQNIRVHTIGGVVRPAEPVMDIIPLDDDLIISARIQPIDIASVSVGMQAEVRFSSFSSKTTPVMFGTIAVLSQDVIEPTSAGDRPYYSARIQVNEASVPLELRERLLPGMPADIIISTGERTFVEYMLRPMTDMFHKGMREH